MLCDAFHAELTVPGTGHRKLQGPSWAPQSPSMVLQEQLQQKMLGRVLGRVLALGHTLGVWKVQL